VGGLAAVRVGVAPAASAAAGTASRTSRVELSLR
jgi:hypothetical protein